MPLKISTGLPNCREGRLNPIGSVDLDGMLHVARVAEELGYYSVWPNEIFGVRPDVAARFSSAMPSLFDAMITMAYVAAHTRRIRITPSTLVLPHHEPILLSRQIATLDHFSGGRITLGLAVGGQAEEFRRMHRTLVNPHRGTLMDEYLEALRALWTDAPASYDGQYTSFEGMRVHPQPVQRPLPIFLAGPSEAALRRVAKYGQGWIVSKILPDAIHARVERLASFAREVGRGEERFEIARQFYVSVGSSEEEARANYRSSLPGASGAAAPGGSAKGDKPEENILIGTPDFIRARLQAYVEAGATEVCLIFYYPDVAAAERQLELFAREVMPAFT